MFLVLARLNKMFNPDTNSTPCRRSWCNHSICPTSCSSRGGEDAYTDSTVAVSCLELLFGVLLLRLVKVLYQTDTYKAIPYHGATSQSCHKHLHRLLPRSATLCTPSGPCRCLDHVGISGSVIKWIRSTAVFEPFDDRVLCALQSCLCWRSKSHC
jgi:hypothetical protein